MYSCSVVQAGKKEREKRRRSEVKSFISEGHKGRVIRSDTATFERKKLGRHPDEYAVLLAIDREVIELRTAVVPAVAYGESQVVQHGDIQSGEGKGRRNIPWMRQVETACRMTEVIQFVEALPEVLRESDPQKVGVRIYLKEEGEACRTEAEGVECGRSE